MLSYGSKKSNDFGFPPFCILRGKHGPHAKGQCFFTNEANGDYLLGLYNSCVFSVYGRILSPTLDFNSGVISQIPIKILEHDKVKELVRMSVSISKELDAEVRRTRRAAERAEVEYRMAMKNQQQILREHAFGCFDREWCLNELLYKLPPRENAEKVLSFLKTGYGKEPFADELFAAYASWLESSKGIRLD